MKRGRDCIEPMGIKFPDESSVFHKNPKTFTPIGSGQSYPFFPSSTAVACQINSASSNTYSFTVKREAVHSSEHQNI
jgi:hypothetical protein